ncbi:MAG: hypothetical protein K0M69_17930 [Youngiibacter sp.]|nr:hypothetical protein [Youngiibacter sp.]
MRVNINKMYAVSKAYRDDFPLRWKDEKFKWEAIKQFQENWDINSNDFFEMFKTATDLTYNLLAAGYYYFGEFDVTA